MKCDQCDSVYINNVFCHETGCPNKSKRPCPDCDATHNCQLCLGYGWVKDCEHCNGQGGWTGYDANNLEVDADCGGCDGAGMVPA